MNTPAPPRRDWNHVEKIVSLTTIACLAAFIGSRLAFVEWWSVRPFDFVFSALALLLMLVVLIWLRRNLFWRLFSVVFAIASQILPMVVRQPVLLIPILGALIPIIVILWALIALSRKDRPRHMVDVPYQGDAVARKAHDDA